MEVIVALPGHTNMPNNVDRAATIPSLVNRFFLRREAGVEARG